MFEHPRLKYCYHAEFLDENRIFLLSEKDNTLLSGALYSDVLTRIREDNKTVDTLFSQLADKYSY